ncbi:MAG TPA: ABC transporter permease, partial [Rhodocyclaceae bacterium]|nr:ABC transporter permease [Rhodocyclaceae bacterium]
MTSEPVLTRAGDCNTLTGPWTLAALLPGLELLRRELDAAGKAGGGWDLSGVTRLDSAGAILLWRAWGGRLPADLVASDEQRHIFDRVAAVAGHEAPPPA